HLADEVAPAESGEVVALLVVQRQQDAHRAAPDEEQLVAGFAAAEDRLARLEAALVHAGLERRQGLLPAALEQLDFAQLQRALLGAFEARFLEDAVLHIFERIVELAERAR